LALSGLFWPADFAEILDDRSGGGFDDAGAPALSADVLSGFDDVNPLAGVQP
jgi:hypothetical protein